MIVTPRFVFLHLHKSGGTFVNRFLLEHVQGSQAIGYHLPRALIPASAAGLPILGTVRSPWDYYVSWYTFQSGMPTPNPIFRIASDGGRGGFEATITRLLTLADDPPALDRLFAALPEQFPGRGINLTQHCLAPLRGSGLGFYSFLYRRMYADGDGVTLLDMAQLRVGLRQYLDATATPLSAAAISTLAHGPSLNTTEHRPYPEYYSPTLAALVAERDALVVKRHGFRFDSPPARAAPHAP